MPPGATNIGRRAGTFAAALGVGLVFSVGLGLLDLPLTAAWHDLYRAAPAKQFVRDPHFLDFWAAAVVYYTVALAAPCVLIAATCAALATTRWWSENRRRLLRAAFTAHAGILLAQAAIAAIPSWMDDWYAGPRLHLLADLSIVAGIAAAYWAAWRGARAAMVRQRLARRLLSAGVVCAALVFVAGAWQLNRTVGFLGGSMPGLTARPRPADGRPNVLLVVLDTLRSDRLGCYGHERNVSPNLDAFAAGATLFEQAVAPSGWTIPSHASLFTGLAESQHGVDWGNLVLADDFLTMAEILRKRGYQTLGISCNSVLTRSAGFAQGFDRWHEAVPIRCEWIHHTGMWRSYRAFVGWSGRRPDWGVTPFLETDKGARKLGRLAAEWFQDEWRGDGPFFAFLNYNETHAPYEPPIHILRRMLTRDQLAVARQISRRSEALAVQPNAEGRASLSSKELTIAQALYDGEVGRVDAEVGRLVDFLRQSELLDNTLVVITSDHGEHLGEHGRMGHFNSLYEPIVHVPLIVRFPRDTGGGRRVVRVVRTIDLLATTMHACGLAGGLPEYVEDVDLRQAADEAGWPDAAVSEVGCQRAAPTTAPGQAGIQPLGARMHCIRSLRTDHWKWIQDQRAGDQLFDVVADPGETKNVAATRIDIAGSLRERLTTWTARMASQQSVPVRAPTPADLLENLRNLGYIQ